MCMTGAITQLCRNPDSELCRCSRVGSRPSQCQWLLPQDLSSAEDGLFMVGGHQARGGYKFSRILVFPESLNLVIGNKCCCLFPWRGRFLVPS